MMSVSGPGSDDSQARRAFREALASWVKVAIASGDPREVFVVTKTIWERTAQNTMMSRDVLEAAWSGKFSSDSFQLPEWNTVQERANAWPPLARHLEHLVGARGRSYMRENLGMLTRPFVPEPTYDEARDAIALPGFDEAQFSETFERLAAFIESETITYVSKVVLVGLRIAESRLPLTLSDMVTIEILPNEEVEEYGQMGLILSPFMGPKNLFVWTGLPWLVAVWRDTVPKDFTTNVKADDYKGSSPGDRLQQVVQNVLGSLAITKVGSVGPGGGATRVACWPFGGMSLTRPRTRVPDFTSNPAQYMQLDDDDCDILQRIFTAVNRDRRGADALRIAQRRLMFAMENELDEDRLLDGMIAAEALFGDPVSKAEIKYKFALRAAYLLEPKDPTRRRALFEDMKNAYDVRSDIVHGSKPKDSKHKIGGVVVPAPKFVEAIEGYIRTALRGLVLADDAAFPPKWDDMIVGDGP